ncbi:MAG: Uncharacterised protein [Bacteroidia bacterium]|jgi:hypothetical protein|nr:MAG: Uncharacterised protein [Bacteroidia bacterium]
MQIKLFCAKTQRIKVSKSLLISVLRFVYILAITIYKSVIKINKLAFVLINYLIILDVSDFVIDSS